MAPAESVSINVYARVRGSSDEVATPAETPGALVCRNLEFKMDGAFDCNTDQKTLYDASTQSQVERVMSGFNSTILAYGQTGSGKTFTMMGPEEADFDNPDAPELGLVPRACGQIFRSLPDGFSVAVSYIEIYNDAVNDLLGEKKDVRLIAQAARRLSRPASQPTPSSSVPPERALLPSARADAEPPCWPPQGAAVVPDGLKVVKVTTVKEVMAQVKVGDGRRVIAAMAMNPRSSRGHGIVAIHVMDQKGNPFGRLTLCDLAGMESSKKSSAVPDKKMSISGASADPIRKEVRRALCSSDPHLRPSSAATATATATSASASASASACCRRRSGSTHRCSRSPPSSPSSPPRAPYAGSQGFTPRPRRPQRRICRSSRARAPWCRDRRGYPIATAS